MRFLILLILVLSLACSSFGDDSKKPAPNLPKIEIGMQYSAVTQILEKAKWKKLEEKTIPAGKSSKRTVVYRYDTKSLTIPEKHIRSKFEFTFIDDQLEKIDHYSKKNELIKKGVQRIYVW